MVGRAAAFIAALASLAVGARAADLPAAPWKHANPFCDVIAAVAPIAGGSQYALGLYAARGTTIEAHVTAISASDAYDIEVADTNLSGAPEDRQSEPVIVSFSDGAAPKYYFVDSYSIDRGKSVTCPSYVFEPGDPVEGAPPPGVTPIFARHLQSLGKLACGKAYQPPGSGGQMESFIGSYGNRPLEVELAAYIDSNGQAIDERVTQSSGVDGVDKAAAGIVSIHHFAPARLLCTPVVGEMRLKLEYEP